MTGYSSTPASVSLSANSHREHPTFNQLLGINNRGQIAGYFGSGAAGHPNKGYVLNLGPSSSFTNENFPGGIQTQVIGINDTGVSVGFWSTQNTKSQTNNNFGFTTGTASSTASSSPPATMRSPRSTSFSA